MIIGAKSDIAKPLAKLYAADGYGLYLAARNSGELDAFANDLRIRSGTDVRCLELDLLDVDSHRAFIESLPEPPFGAIVVAGYLGDQASAQDDFAEARSIIDTNFTGAVSVLNLIANDLERRKAGFIVGISSVAGDRGRQSNYIYGSAKAAFSTYLSGLRNRLFAANVQVLTVKPGFMATRMTAGLDTPAALTAQPDDAARAIFKAQQKGRSVIYTKWVWRWIMCIIKSIPEGLFKRLKL